MYSFSLTPSVLKYIYWSSEDIWKFRKNTSEVVEEIKHYVHSHKMTVRLQPVIVHFLDEPSVHDYGKAAGQRALCLPSLLSFPSSSTSCMPPPGLTAGCWDPLSWKIPQRFCGRWGEEGGLTQQIGEGGAHLTAEDLHIDYHIVKQQKSSKKRCFADFMVIVHFSPQMPMCYYFVLWLIQKLVN